MNPRSTLFVTAVSAFAGGVITGLLLAPQTGRETRQRIAETAKGSTQWLGEQLDAVEARISTVEGQIQSATTRFAETMREATRNTVDQHTPTLPDDPEPWSIQPTEVAQDLRHMPRK